MTMKSMRAGFSYIPMADMMRLTQNQRRLCMQAYLVQ